MKTNKKRVRWQSPPSTHKCCRASFPFSLTPGDAGTQWKFEHLCADCWILLPGGKCWLPTSLFYSFHKTQSHRFNRAPRSQSPISLTVPLSPSPSLAPCLNVFGHGKTDRGKEKTRRLPVDTDEVTRLRPIRNISSRPNFPLRCFAQIFSQLSQRVTELRYLKGRTDQNYKSITTVFAHLSKSLHTHRHRFWHRCIKQTSTQTEFAKIKSQCLCSSASEECWMLNM